MESNSILVALDRLTEQQQSDVEMLSQTAKHRHFYQLPSWGELVHGYQNPKVLLSYKNGVPIAYSLVRSHFVKIINRNKFYIERGPVFNDEDGLSEHLAALIRELKFHNGLWVTISSYLHEDSKYESLFRRYGFSEDRKNNFAYLATITLDLAQSTESIRSGFRRSLKTQLNKAQRLEVVFERCEKFSEFEAFVTLFNRFRSDKGLVLMDKRGCERIYKQLIEENDKNCLLLAKMDDKVLAAIGLFFAGDSVVYEWGCSTDEEAYRKLPLSHLLHWRAIEWAKAAGYRYYDFGGYWKELGDSNSINRFKSGFSKNIETMMVPKIFYFSPWLSRALGVAAYVKNLFRD